MSLSHVFLQRDLMRSQKGPHGHLSPTPSVCPRRIFIPFSPLAARPDDIHVRPIAIATLFGALELLPCRRTDSILLPLRPARSVYSLPSSDRFNLVLLTVVSSPHHHSTPAKMKDLASRESLAIPEGVTVTLKARIVTVTGPRGTLTKAARHIQMDMQVVSITNRVGRRS